MSRLLSLIIVAVFAWFQGESPWTVAHPNIAEFSTLWDSGFYYRIANFGYQTTLPVDTNGHVEINEWAFLPVYPLITRWIHAVTFVPWSVVAIGVSLLAGWGFSLVFHRLMSIRLTLKQSSWAVVFVCVAPISPLFGFGYAEALFLLLLALALLLLELRRYWLLAALLPVLALTRPGVIAFAIVLAGHWVLRWMHRKHDPFNPLGIGALIVWAGLWGLAWPAIAAVTTGRIDAYLATELAWRAGFTGYTPLIPGSPWFQAGNWVWGQPLGTIVPIVVILGCIGLLWLPSARRLGSTLWLWIASYGFYLFLVFFPTSSTARILAPLFPVAGMLAQIRLTSVKVALVLVGVVGQVIWVWLCWAILPGDTTPA